jgi:hypothetical protein
MDGRVLTLGPENEPDAMGLDNHIFNPLLPTTPGFARRPRRNESFFSANGSPIVILGSAESPSSEFRVGRGGCALSE